MTVWRKAIIIIIIIIFSIIINQTLLLRDRNEPTVSKTQTLALLLMLSAW